MAAHISQDQITLLIKLNILDSNLKVTPEAYTASVSRKPVDEQAKLLGIPVIIRPETNKALSPEKQFIDYFRKRTKDHIDGGESYSTEGYLIKQLLTNIIPGFDYRSRSHNYNKKAIEKQIDVINHLDNHEVLRRCESFTIHSEIKFIFDDDKPNTDIDERYLRHRFREAKAIITSLHIDERTDSERIEIAKGKDREEIYTKYNLRMLELWDSLSKEEWHKLANIVLENWDKMYAGWPDLTIFSRKNGLTLIEIKGKDKIHPAQVFTLLKLKEVLGPNRIAIGWINSGKIKSSGQVYKAHMEEVTQWLNTNWTHRTQFTQEIHKNGIN